MTSKFKKGGERFHLPLAHMGLWPEVYEIIILSCIHVLLAGQLSNALYYPSQVCVQGSPRRMYALRCRVSPAKLV